MRPARIAVKGLCQPVDLLGLECGHDVELGGAGRRSATRIRNQARPGTSKSVARKRLRDHAGGSRLPRFAGFRQSPGGLVLSPPAAGCQRMHPDRSFSSNAWLDSGLTGCSTLKWIRLTQPVSPPSRQDQADRQLIFPPSPMCRAVSAVPLLRRVMRDMTICRRRRGFRGRTTGGPGRGRWRGPRAMMDGPGSFGAA
jgi:hypothetical protein